MLQQCSRISSDFFRNPDGSPHDEFNAIMFMCPTVSERPELTGFDVVSKTMLVIVHGFAAAEQSFRFNLAELSVDTDLGRYSCLVLLQHAAQLFGVNLR